MNTPKLLLQLTASTGPEECCLAVRKALDGLVREALADGVRLEVVEQVPGARKDTLRSALLVLEGPAAPALAGRWQGTLQWACPSPYRPLHRRKNWFIGGHVFHEDDPVDAVLRPADLRFEALRASGPGGQHVNKTDSAVRATHLPSGLSVKVQAERSQHANRRLACALLACKLAQQALDRAGEGRAERRGQHHRLQRGGAVQVFKGADFARQTG
jgi:peptide chain release factor